jgi:hypothetical protein
VLHVFAPALATQTGWNLGTSLAGVGDVNRDGFADFVIGAPGYFDSGGGSGAIFLESGRDGLLLYRHQDLTGSDPKRFGTSVALASDVNGDGIPEFVAGASVESSPTVVDAGSASLRLGDDLFVDASPRMATAGDALEIDVGQGAAGGLYALLLVDVNGTPTATILTIAALDSTGRSTFHGQVPPGLGTMTAGFKAFAIDTRHKVIESAVETLYLH